MYVYINSEPSLWTVGFYSPSGEWYPESDHDHPTEAAEKTAFLNGGSSTNRIKAETLLKYYTKKVAASNKHIERINAMIEKVVDEADDAADLEDLEAERSNAERDKQLYFQFTKDLEDLL